MESATITRLSRGALLLIFLAAAGPRCGFAFYRIYTVADVRALDFPDERDYWTIARNLHAGRGLLDPMGFRGARMPLYPAFLSLFVPYEDGVLYAKGVQCVIGALAAVAIATLGARTAGRRVGVLAGLVVACDPFLIFFSPLLLTETLFITALAALWTVGLDCESQGVGALNVTSVLRWCAIGVLGALCAYLRESSLLLVLIWILFLATWRFRCPIMAPFGAEAADRPLVQSAIGRLAGPALAIAIVIASLLPWAIRNSRVTGDFCWLTHRGGVSLFDGVGPQATGKGNLEPVYRLPEAQHLTEVEWDRYFLRRSWEAIRSDPVRIARLALTKMVRTWSPVPNADEYQSRLIRLISAGWTIPTWTMAVIGVLAWRRRRALVLAVLMPALYFTAVHALFVGSVRYRLPAVAITSVLTAVGIDAVLRRWRRA